MEWTRLHTVHWAKWVNRTFAGIKLNEKDWFVSSLTRVSFVPYLHI
jgi:hypothetical protein